MNNEFYEHIILTRKSFEFQIRVLAGEKMEFTRVEVGDGKVEESEDLKNFTGIKNMVTTGSIVSIVQEGHQVKLTCSIDSYGLTKATLYREVGIYARIGDEEILYAYINSGEQFDYIVPLYKTNQRDFTTNILSLYIVVGDAENIEVTLNNTIIVENSININMLDNSVKNYIDERVMELIKEHAPSISSNSKFELVKEDENNYIGLIREEDLEEVNENDFVLNL